MADHHPFQPTIRKLNLSSMEPSLTKEEKVEAVFKIEYEISWPQHSFRFWRMDLSLLEIDSDSSENFDTLSEILSSQSDWEQIYMAIREKGIRVFGPEAVASVLLDTAPAPWSINKTFGAIKLFIAEQYVNAANNLGDGKESEIFHRVTEKIVEVALGDGWCFSEYQSDKKKWWKKWRLDLEGHPGITRSGEVRLTVPVEELEKDGEQIAFYEPEQGWQIIKDELNFRVFGRVVQVLPECATKWSNKV